MGKFFPSLDQGPAVRPADISVWYERGNALANVGKYVEALDYFDQVLEAQRDHCAAWVFRAVVLIHLGRYQEALDSSEKALRIQPADVEAWTFRGVALYRLSRYQEAYTSYSKALRMPQRSLGQRLVQLLSRTWKLLLQTGY